MTRDRMAFIWSVLGAAPPVAKFTYLYGWWALLALILCCLVAISVIHDIIPELYLIWLVRKLNRERKRS